MRLEFLFIRIYPLFQVFGFSSLFYSVLNLFITNKARLFIIGISCLPFFLIHLSLSSELETSIKILVSYAKVIISASFFYIGFNLCKDTYLKKKYLSDITKIGVFVCLVVIANHVFQLVETKSIGFGLVPKFLSASPYIIDSMVLNPGIGKVWIFNEQYDFSFFLSLSRNSFAYFLVFCLLVVRAQSTSKVKKILFQLLFLIVLFQTYSRGAFLSLFCTVIVWQMLFNLKFSITTKVILLLIIIMSLINYEALISIKSNHSTRLDNYMVSIEYFIQNPFGYAHLPRSSDLEIPVGSHSQYLSLLVLFGVFSFIIAGLYFKFLLDILLYKNDIMRNDPLNVALVQFMIYSFFHQFTYEVWFDFQSIWILFISIGMLRYKIKESY